MSDVNETTKLEPDAREKVSIRLSPASVQYIDKAAAEQRRSRSETIRLMLAYSAKHMPKGWLP